MRIERTLNELGLDKNKGGVYLALLQLGNGTAQDIAKKAGLPRTTTYEILQYLLNLDLISLQTKKRGKIYLAQSPEKLYSIVEKRKKLLASIMLDLSSSYHVLSKKPRVKFFEGMEGVKEVWEDTLKIPNKTFCEIGSIIDLYNTREYDFMKDYVQRRIGANIRLRAIRSLNVKKETAIEDIWPTSEKELREVHYVKFEIDCPLSFLIYDNKVGIIDTQHENFGMIIESADFYDTIKNLFEAIWQVTPNRPPTNYLILKNR